MKDRETAPPPSPARAAREKRLAEALRANLRRRKGGGQPRASETEPGERPENPPDSSSNKGEGG